MGTIFKALGGSLISEVGKVLDNLITTPAERLEAQRKLAEIEANFQIALLAADNEFAKAQQAVIEAEAKGSSWLQRNWRPIVMMEFAFIIGWNYIIAPIFSVPSLELVPEMWELLKIGMGGYIMGRSAEKIVQVYAESRPR